MSIYIKDIKMPTKGYKLLLVHADGSVQTTDGETSAIPVPEHGRLGDLDEFKNIKYELPDGQKAFNRGFHSGVQYVQRMIMDAPTIIPASEEETE